MPYLCLLDLLEEDGQALDSDGLHVIGLIVQLLEHRSTDATLENLYRYKG
jgi:hypothetical protein